MSELLQAALWAAGQGWWVHPLTPGRKTPGTKHGLKDASCDPAQIREWWTERPTANIGVATEPSGLAVVDIDDLDDLAVLQLPETLCVTTGSGGEHHIYTGDIPNSAKKLAPGTDTRGRGGYIVIPPSDARAHEPDHVQAYTWRALMPPQPVPQWIVDRLAKPPPSAVSGTPAFPAGPNSPWGERVLHEEVGRIAAAPAGQRNPTLFAAACKLFEAVKGGHVDEAVAWDALRRAAEMCGHDGDTEATLQSAWGRTEPRHPQPRAEIPRATVGAPPPAPQPHVEVEAGPRQSRLMSYSQLRALPPATWLLPGLLPDGFTVLWAPPNAGKTFIALDWTLTLASSGVPVVFCAGEGASGLTSRIEAWRIANPKLDPTAHLNLLALGAFPYLLQRPSVEELYADIDSMPVAPRLIVIDTWARALVGGDENSALDSGRAIAVLDGLRERFGTSSLVLHHSPALQPGQPHARRFRGSTALDGAMDCAWRLDAPGEQDTFPVWRLTNTKMKEHAPPRPIELRLEPTGESLAPNPPAALITGAAGRTL